MGLVLQSLTIVAKAITGSDIPLSEIYKSIYAINGGKASPAPMSSLFIINEEQEQLQKDAP
jgi:hypothetical protein